MILELVNNIISSVDKEGTAEGFDLELTKMISESVNIPVIAHGGADQSKMFIDVIKIGKADAVSLASILHMELKINLINIIIVKVIPNFVKKILVIRRLIQLICWI